MYTPLVSSGTEEPASFAEVGCGDIRLRHSGQNDLLVVDILFRGSRSRHAGAVKGPRLHILLLKSRLINPRRYEYKTAYGDLAHVEDRLNVASRASSQSLVC